MRLHSKAEIERFLRRDPGLHLYAIGDLDPFFWPHTTWFGLKGPEGLEEIVLLYAGSPLPVLLAFTARPKGPMRELLREILPVLPPRFYAHLSPGLMPVFEEAYDHEFHGDHNRMIWKDRGLVDSVDFSRVERLAVSDLEEVVRLYESSYPGNWFDPRMLETGLYFGLRLDGALASIAGVHVFSREYRVAALGNVATLPQHRGRGLARRVTGALCRSVREVADPVGLNVHCDNPPAISCYRSLGFEKVAQYEEHLLISR